MFRTDKIRLFNWLFVFEFFRFNSNPVSSTYPFPFQLILEKGEMKVKGYTSHVLPNGVFERAMILVYSEDAKYDQKNDDS